MLVRFVSSEAGEIIMFADTAHALLSAIEKPCTAEGVFTHDQMMPAAAALRRAIVEQEKAEETERNSAPPPEETEKTSEEKSATEKAAETPIRFSSRAWPLIEMLERTAARGDAKANIVWRAPEDF